MKLFLSLIITCGSVLVIGSAGENVSITTVGCTILIQWNYTTYSEFYIDIWNAKDQERFSKVTRENRFTYDYVQPGQLYRITWTPIETINNKRKRNESLKNESDVTIPNNCSLQSSFSKKPLIPKTGQSTFCTVYFWVSVFAFPVVIGAVLVLTYICFIRKSQGPKHREQKDHQTARSAGVIVKSTCYSNNATQAYEEIQYSLAQNIDFQQC